MRVVVAMLVPVLLVGCDSASKRLEQGRSLVDERKYDEATRLYESIVADYPESPEAGQVPVAVDDARVAVADDLFADKNFMEAGRAFKRFATGDRTSEDEVAALGRSKYQQDLARAWQWVEVAEGAAPHDDGAFDTMLNLWRKAGETDKPVNDEATTAFKAVLATWFCEHRSEFTAVANCRAVTLDDAVNLMNARATRDQVSSTLFSCTRGVAIGDVCGQEVSARDVLTPMATTYSTATAFDARNKDWKNDVRKDWSGTLGSLTALARTCERTKAESASAVRQAAGVEQVTAEMFWSGIAKGTMPNDSPLSRMIRSYQTEFASNVLVLGKTLKSEMWSAECNEAVDGALDRIYKDCAENGSPVDVSWISTFLPDECPFPMFDR